MRQAWTREDINTKRTFSFGHCLKEGRRDFFDIFSPSNKIKVRKLKNVYSKVIFIYVYWHFPPFGNFSHIIPFFSLTASLIRAMQKSKRYFCIDVFPLIIGHLDAVRSWEETVSALPASHTWLFPLRRKYGCRIGEIWLQNWRNMAPPTARGNMELQNWRNTLCRVKEILRPGQFLTMSLYHQILLSRWRWHEQLNIGETSGKYSDDLEDPSFGDKIEFSHLKTILWII